MTYFTRGATLADFVEVARDQGLDPFRLALAAGLSAAHLTDPDLQVPAETFGRLLEMAAERGAVEDFGLRVAERWNLATLGVVGQVVREQPSARKALEALVHYIWVQNETLSMTLEDGGGVVVVRLGALSGGRRRGRQGTEFLLSCLVRVIRGLMGATWTPLETHLGHAAPTSLVLHRRALGPSLVFESSFEGLVCGAADLERALPRADPGMARRLEAYVEDLAARQGRRLADEVRDLVVARLPGGDCTVARLAAQLRIDRRTIHRRLAVEGTSFTQILDAARRSLAAAHLERSGRRLDLVAEQLGFSSLSAFSRWHRLTFSETASARRARTWPPRPHLQDGIPR